MIVGEQKPVKEIMKTVARYKKLLILGCGTCVKTCFAGGEDEVADGTAVERDLERGEQETVALGEVVEHLRELLEKD